MYVLNKERNEFVDIAISGRVFVRGTTVCCGKTEERPCYLGGYETEKDVQCVMEMLFNAIENPRIIAFRMPQDKDVKAMLANLPNFPERHSVTGRKNKGHGGS